MYYRDGFVYGAWKDFDVTVDAEKVGELDKNKSMRTYQLELGSHRITPGKDNKGIDIDLSSEVIHVIGYKVRFGILGAVPKLEMKTLDEAKDDSEIVREAMMNEGMMGDEEMMDS